MYNLFLIPVLLVAGLLGALQDLDTGSFTSATLIVLWSVIQAFALEYLWFVKDWFSALEPRKKQTVNALGVFIITAAAYVLSLLDVINAFTPDLQGLVAAFTAFFLALGIGQGVHLGTKKSS